MSKHLLLCVIIVLLASARLGAQDAGYTERAKKYIDQYSTLAILEQQKSGIPASITLGQGILETEAGASELMTEANNHFGIKCKNGWQGPTYSHTDDAPDECFKKYSCAAESYSDHSALLKRNPRYAPLLVLPQTDYVAWAKCLKKCGYATNPQYAERLIKIIEDFKLQEYTYSALDSSLVHNHSATALNGTVLASDTTQKQPTSHDTLAAAGKATDTHNIKNMADSARNVIMHPPHVVTQPVVKAAVHADSVKSTLPAAVTQPGTTASAAPESKTEESKIVVVNGLNAVYCYKDEMLLQYAMKYHIGYPQLLAMNDLTDGPLPFNTYIYLEHKLTRGTNAQHVVRDGESLLMIAQSEGIQLKSLLELNSLNPNEEPIDGTVLQLQTAASSKPAVNVSNITAHTRNAIVMGNEQPAPASDYIALKKPAVTYADTAKPRTAATGQPPVVNNEPVNKVTAQPIPQPQAATEQPPVVNNGPVNTAIAQPTPQPQAIPPATPVAAKATATTARFYTVRKGDTAFSIAKKNNITLLQLMEWNGLDDGQVKVGANLKISE